MCSKLLGVQIVYLFSVSGMAIWQVVNIIYTLYGVQNCITISPNFFPNLFCCHKIIEH